MQFANKLQFLQACSTPAAAAAATAAAEAVQEVLQLCSSASHLLGTLKHALDQDATRLKGAARQRLVICGCDVVDDLFSARPCDLWLTLSCLV